MFKWQTVNLPTKDKTSLLYPRYILQMRNRERKTPYFNQILQKTKACFFTKIHDPTNYTFHYFQLSRECFIGFSGTPLLLERGTPSLDMSISHTAGWAIPRTPSGFSSTSSPPPPPPLFLERSPSDVTLLPTSCIVQWLQVNEQGDLVY